MNKEEIIKALNNLIEDFNDYSTDYTKTACDYYKEIFIEIKKQLEEKDKVIDEAFKLSQELKEQIELTLNDYNKERTYENAYEQIDDIEYHYEDIKEIVEILERGKNANT